MRGTSLYILREAATHRELSVIVHSEDRIAVDSLGVADVRTSVCNDLHQIGGKICVVFLTYQVG